MKKVNNKDIGVDSGKLPGGREGIGYYGIKVRLNLVKILKAIGKMFSYK